MWDTHPIKGINKMKQNRKTTYIATALQGKPGSPNKESDGGERETKFKRLKTPILNCLFSGCFHKEKAVG